MALSSFRLNVLLRALAFATLCVTLAWVLLNTEWVATPFLCGALILLSLIELIRYVERTSRDLAGFLTLVTHQDFSTPVRVPQKGPAFAELDAAYQVLVTELRRLHVQKAAEHQYLESVLEHLSVALCCFDEQGMVTMMNEPARRLFGVPHLNSVRSFARIDERLPERLRSLGDGERTLLSVRRGDDILQLVLYATQFELLERRYTLVSFQNIRDELDRQEIDSWQKLIRVLTHEIMNSVTPITSLSRLIRDTLVDESHSPPAFRGLSEPEQSDILKSVTAIHTRSTGLVDFVEAYRRFARLPRPVFANVEVVSLLDRVRTLQSPALEAQQIALDVRCLDAGLTVHADVQQIEQVLINLIRNAADAVAGRAAPRIELRGSRNEQGAVLLQVSDNGVGIDPAHLDSIFVPFFTTKRSGTGVGLSISRQIVLANRGTLSVRSSPGEGAVFTLKFQAGNADSAAPCPTWAG
jgi:nitrogen fixation/metabolism regulation signal transduction histidine kinase